MKSTPTYCGLVQLASRELHDLWCTTGNIILETGRTGDTERVLGRIRPSYQQIHAVDITVPV
jgi:hypothetical protein